MRILGIDPALSITGYGIIDEKARGLSLVGAGVVQTRAAHALPERLAVIYREITRIVQDFNPDCMVLEKLYVHYRHPTTSYILGQARGIICLVCAQKELSFFEYAATRVKKAIVGAGLASKAQVQRMVSGSLGLAQLPKYKDITDALALAIAHSYISRTAQEVMAKK
ncbi:MAG: crossover junction endodeoxyribonuclease RuvC [Candidatus Omnitrophica bacterium]|nr:crossover junction endodeoxyribonuclease RuvC [Candidatus Omnitrophota bacterium]